ncbi:MAG: YhjD/YihY/BrkB family envelope integrity protein, partial [Corynebacterium sp.]|nr:YhjD/YihY/BrkB family envelope integrity protein [Corynebacterium sp.]
MPTTTQSSSKKTDHYGIERANADDPGAVDKIRSKSGFVDHLMRMNERYGAEGGNQFAAGITYYSVLSIFPLAMLIVATVAAVLANREDLLNDLQSQITSSIDGDMGDTVNEILDTAIGQRRAMFGIGGLTTLWS